MATGGAAGYAVSRLGTLVYVAATGAQVPRSLVWVDRAGKETPIRAPLRTDSEPRLSPDGARVALTIRDGHRHLDLGPARATLTRLTSDPSADQRPVWGRSRA